MARTLSIVTILALALTAGDADAKCARVLLEPRVLTHAADKIPANGGILVGYDSTTDGGADRFAGHDPAVNDDWLLVSGARKLRPKIEVLAPGLAVYQVRPFTRLRAGKLALRDGGAGRALLGTWRIGKAQPSALAAPQPRSIASVTTTGNNLGRGRMDTTITTLELSAAPPPGAVAVIAYRGSGAAATPIAWARVTAGAADAIQLYRSPGRCGTEPDGLIAPAAGESIALAWVDAFGRRSPRSAAIVVR